jgi:hypothetical protein
MINIIQVYQAEAFLYELLKDCIHGSLEDGSALHKPLA